jgi:hypothetical protein
MTLIHLVIILVVIGLVLWLINTYIPMQAGIKKILNIVVLIAVIVFLLNLFGIFGDFSSVKVGHIGK